MDIEFVCEHCGGMLKVQEFLGGQSIECYHCHGSVVVPMPGQKAVIEFSCLGCGSQFRVPVARAGSRTKCPKCDAMLVVPDASSRVAPPPEPSVRGAQPSAPPPASGLEDLPPTPSSVLRQHTGARIRRPGMRSGPPGAVPEEDGYVTPPAKGVSPGMIIFWVGLGAVFFIALIMFTMREKAAPNAGAGATFAPLYADVKVEGGSGAFQITNNMREGWRSPHIIVETDRGEFSTTTEDMAPNQVLLLGPDRFSGPGGSMTAADRPRRLTITATLSNGRTAKFTAGIRPAPTPANPPPARPAPAEPASPAQPPDEEGGTVTE